MRLYLLWEKRWNRDGQQFHQYPQNEQPPLTYNHWTLQNRPRHVALNILVLAWDIHQNCDGVKTLIILLNNKYCCYNCL